MTLLTVDENLCNKDGLCAAECPMMIIRMKDGDGFPEMAPGGEAACLVCGHCVAVCPFGAMSHKKVPVEKSPEISPELTINADQAVQFLRSRRSVRHFKKQPVETGLLRKLIETARYAPTGGNIQPLEWVVITDQEKMKELSQMTVEWMRETIQAGQRKVPPYYSIIVNAWDAGFDAVLRNAPALVIASAPKDDPNGMVNVALALSYFDLAAPAMGLGVCWAGLLKGAMFNQKPISQAAGVPDDRPYNYPLMVGYPKFKYHRLPERKPPRITFM